MWRIHIIEVLLINKYNNSCEIAGFLKPTPLWDQNKGEKNLIVTLPLLGI